MTTTDQTPDPQSFAERAASAAIGTLCDLPAFRGLWAGAGDVARDLTRADLARAIREQDDRVCAAEIDEARPPDPCRAVALNLAVQWATYSGHTVGEPDSELVVQAAHAFAAFLRGDQPDPQAAYRRPEDQR